MTATTSALGRAGARSAERIERRLEAADQPAGRVELLDAALDELDDIASTLDEIDLGTDAALIGPLRGAHRDLRATIERARSKLDEGRQLIRPVRDLFQGPTTFVLLAANNSEMAGGSGLALSAGLIEFHEGEIELGDVVPAGDLRLRSSVALPGDLPQIYRPTGIGIDFRSTTRSPNLPAMGPVLTEMVSRLDPGQLGATEVQGVIVVDALALKEVLRVTGPVDVDGQRVDHDSVLADVLYENYLQFGSTEDRPERVSYQGEIAKAAFDALTDRDVPAAELAQALLGATEGRHLMAWASSPALQEVWQELGLAGELDPAGLMVSFQNYSANKLDWFLRPSATLDVDLLPSGDYRAHLRLRLPVPALSELGEISPYIVGPNPERQGTFLTVHLPDAAYDITTPNASGFRTKGRDGPMQVRTFLVDVPTGTTLDRQIDFSLPRSVSALRLLPSARLEPLPLTVDDVATVTDAEPTVISWIAAAPGPVERDHVPVLVRAFAVAGLTGTVVASLALALSRRLVLLGGRWRSVKVAQLASLASLAAFALAAIFALMLATPRV